MIIALLAAAAGAFWAPPLLARLTARGVSAGLGLAAWLTAMASTLACAAVALVLLARVVAAGWDGLAEVVCRSVTGRMCARSVYSGAALEVALGLACLAAVAVATMLAWRYGRALRQAGRQTRAHAGAARITGRRLPGDAAVVVLDAARPAAYCLAGLPPVIVLTAGAVTVLDGAQLAAVLAHERAHLAGRHHQLTALARGLAAVAPAVPLFTRGAAEVARLAEMRADDVAARRGDRGALMTALLAMATGTAVPAAALQAARPGRPRAALGAAACAVTARIERLLDVPGRSRRAWRSLAMIAAITALAATPCLAALLS